MKEYESGIETWNKEIRWFVACGAASLPSGKIEFREAKSSQQESLVFFETILERCPKGCQH